MTWRPLALIVLALAGACNSTGPGVVASFAVHAGSVTVRPEELARFDGDVFTAWAGGTAVGEVFGQMTGLPLFGPRQVDAGVAVVHVRSSDYTWQGKPGDPLPESARVLFRAGEIAAWQLSFVPDP